MAESSIGRPPKRIYVYSEDFEKPACVLVPSDAKTVADVVECLLKKLELPHESSSVELCLRHPNGSSGCRMPASELASLIRDEDSVSLQVKSFKNRPEEEIERSVGRGGFPNAGKRQFEGEESEPSKKSKYTTVTPEQMATSIEPKRTSLQNDFDQSRFPVDGAHFAHGQPSASNQPQGVYHQNAWMSQDPQQDAFAGYSSSHAPAFSLRSKPDPRTTERRPLVPREPVDSYTAPRTYEQTLNSEPRSSTAQIRGSHEEGPAYRSVGGGTQSYPQNTPQRIGQTGSFPVQLSTANPARKMGPFQPVDPEPRSIYAPRNNGFKNGKPKAHRESFGAWNVSRERKTFGHVNNQELEKRHTPSVLAPPGNQFVIPNNSALVTKHVRNTPVAESNGSKPSDGQNTEKKNAPTKRKISDVSSTKNLLASGNGTVSADKEAIHESSPLKKSSGSLQTSGLQSEVVAPSQGNSAERRKGSKTGTENSKLISKSPSKNPAKIGASKSPTNAPVHAPVKKPVSKSSPKTSIEDKASKSLSNPLEKESSKSSPTKKVVGTVPSSSEKKPVETSRNLDLKVPEIGEEEFAKLLGKKDNKYPDLSVRRDDSDGKSNLVSFLEAKFLEAKKLKSTLSCRLIFESAGNLSNAVKFPIRPNLNRGQIKIVLPLSQELLDLLKRVEKGYVRQFIKGSAAKTCLADLDVDSCKVLMDPTKYGKGRDKASQDSSKIPSCILLNPLAIYSFRLDVPNQAESPSKSPKSKETTISPDGKKARSPDIQKGSPSTTKSKRNTCSDVSPKGNAELGKSSNVTSTGSEKMPRSAHNAKSSQDKGKDFSSGGLGRVNETIAIDQNDPSNVTMQTEMPMEVRYEEGEDLSSSVALVEFNTNDCSHLDDNFSFSLDQFNVLAKAAEVMEELVMKESVYLKFASASSVPNARQEVPNPL